MDLRTDILPHRDRLYRLALSITAHTAEAEDVVQETMLRAWQRRAEWEQIDNPQAWLVQICKNLALDHKKRLDHTRSLSTSEPEAAPSRFLQAERTTPTIEARESVDILQRLIAQLPPPQDDLVRLRDIEGLSYQEIAATLNISETQVRVYLHRARQRLRQQYALIQGFGLTS